MSHTQVSTECFVYEWRIDNFAFLCNREAYQLKLGTDLDTARFSPPDHPDLAEFTLQLRHESHSYKSCNMDYVDNYTRLILGMKRYQSDRISVCTDPLQVQVKVHYVQTKKSTPIEKSAKLIYGGSNAYVNDHIVIPKFIKMTDLETKAALTIVCEIRYLSNQITTHVHTDVITARLKAEAVEAIREKNLAFLESGQYADVVLHVAAPEVSKPNDDVPALAPETGSPKEFAAHKLILSASSPVFARMFTADMREKARNRVEIADIRVEVVEELLRFIYSGSIDKLEQYAVELFQAADKYAIESLKGICGRYLTNRLSLETMIDSLVLADMHNEDSLKKAAIDLIKRNSKQVFSNPKWAEVVANRPSLVTEVKEEVFNFLALGK